ncbi:MAG TPA: hypothetical protein VNJ09_03295 [Chthonomonadales bacterium]|nr:hypothetical protein [Chthonomonadales bacterium]
MSALKRQSLLIGIIVGITPLFVPALAQLGLPGRPGQQGALRNLVPPGIDAIVGYWVDNSLIVRDPPVNGSQASAGDLRIQAQWLEIERGREDNAVRRFKTVDSPASSLTSGRLGRLTIQTPGGTGTYPVRARLDEEGFITLTLYATSSPDTPIYRLDRGNAVRLGDSVVVSRRITPLAEGGQREFYLQFTFSPAVQAGGPTRLRPESLR